MPSFFEIAATLERLRHVGKSRTQLALESRFSSRGSYLAIGHEGALVAPSFLVNASDVIESVELGLGVAALSGELAAGLEVLQCSFVVSRRRVDDGGVVHGTSFPSPVSDFFGESLGFAEMDEGRPIVSPAVGDSSLHHSGVGEHLEVTVSRGRVAQCFAGFQALLVPASSRKSLYEPVVRLDVAGIDLERVHERGNGFVNLEASGIAPTQSRKGVGIVRRRKREGLEVGDRGVEIFSGFINPGEAATQAERLGEVGL